MDVTDWLRSLGLEQYAPAFQENNIGCDLLPSVTADDLKDLGVASVGHGRRLLEGIAALRAGSGANYERPEAPVLVPKRSQSSTQPDAERRQDVNHHDSAGQTVIVRTLFENWVANWRREETAGPVKTTPLVLKREPWHGQTKV